LGGGGSLLVLANNTGGRGGTHRGEASRDPYKLIITKGMTQKNVFAFNSWQKGNKGKGENIDHVFQFREHRQKGKPWHLVREKKK